METQAWGHMLTGDRPPLRVLHVCGALAGGVGNVLMNYYRHMDRSKVQFDFLTHAEPDGATRAEVEAMGGSIRVATPKGTSLWRNLRDTRRYINQRSPHQVIHVHTASPTSFVYLLAARLAGKRTRAVHSHATDLETPAGSIQHKVHRLLQPVLRGSATDLLACSRAAGDWLYGAEAQPSVRVVPNAIVTDQFRFSPAMRHEMRCSLGLEGRLVVGHIGRLAEQKNPRALIAIFEHIVKLRPDALLLWVGDGPLMDAVRAQVEEAGLGESVRFVGWRDDVPALMQAMDLFLLPSLFEGLPLVLVEAQAAGLPCLASSKVTEEVRLTPLLHFLDLDEGPIAWAASAVELTSAPERSSDTSLIEQAGYDITTAAQRLGAWYLDKVDSAGPDR